MSKIEKAIFLSPYLYLGLVLLPAWAWCDRTDSWAVFGLVGIDKLIFLFGVFLAPSMATILRDLYLRKLPEGVSRYRWLLLMFYTGGIGYFVYVFRYAWKPRRTG